MFPKDIGPLRPRYAYADGDAYEKDGTGRWEATHWVELQEGEALVFAPSVIHESVNTDEVCAASITYQFDAPLAAKYWDTQLATVRRAFDVNECWGRFGELYTAFLRGAPPAALRNGGLLPAEVPALAQAEFAKRDADGDGCLRAEEMPASEGRGRQSTARWRQAIVAVHDGDGDGCVSAAELERSLTRWALNERVVAEEWMPDGRRR